jgi:hypothetical protein
MRLGLAGTQKLCPLLQGNPIHEGHRRFRTWRKAIWLALIVLLQSSENLSKSASVIVSIAGSELKNRDSFWEEFI